MTRDRETSEGIVATPRIGGDNIGTRGHDACQQPCKTRENSNFWKKGKIVISVKIKNLFSRSRMKKWISPLQSSREI